MCQESYTGKLDRKRSEGSPRKRWIDNIGNDLELLVKNLKEKVENRK